MATETITPLPELNLTFEEDTITFLAEEDAQRFNRQFNGFVVYGATAGTSGSLSHTVAELEAFVHGYYVFQEATVLGYTAERRTYVFADSVETRDPEIIASGGSGATFKLRADRLVLIECDSGSEMPTLSVPGLVQLFYADTDTTSITNITDLRNLSPIVSSTKIIDPLRYGLVGDDLTDNSAAFQALVDALPEGSIIQFGQGIFRFAPTVTISKSLTIRGAGSSQLGTVLRITEATGNGIEINSSDPVELRNFVLDASVTRVSGYGILFSGPALLSSVEGVTFDGHVDQLGFTNGRGFSVRGCYFLDGLGSDIDIASLGVDPNTDAIIDGNIFASTSTGATQGIKIRKTVGLSIFGNRFVGHGRGILVDLEGNSQGIDIHDNSFRGQALININFTRTAGAATGTYIKISNNIIVNITGSKAIYIGPGAAGVYLHGEINGNIIASSITDFIGIDLLSDSGFIVSENNIQLPNGGGDSSVCIHVGTNSAAANVGHNGYVGNTFIDNESSTATAVPIFVAFGAISVDPGSIAANTTVGVTATVAAALLGDVLTLNRPPISELPATIDHVGQMVSAAGQITIFLRNNSGSPVDAGAGTWTGSLIRGLI